MNDNLSSAQFHQYKRTTYRIEPSQFKRQVQAVNHKTGKMVGFLAWKSEEAYNDPSERNAISDVTVDPKHRGRGIATAMLNYAQQQNPKIHHSRMLTDDGKAWSVKHPLGEQ